MLLIDDPPNPCTPRQRRLLDSARRLPGEVERLLSSRAERFDWPSSGSRRPSTVTATRVPRTCTPWPASTSTRPRGSDLWARSTRWSDHNERFFATHVLGQLAADLALIAGALVRRPPTTRRSSRWRASPSSIAGSPGRSGRRSQLPAQALCLLSAEANKAMNLNSYIGLMGGSYREVRRRRGLTLVPRASTRPIWSSGLRLRAHDRRRQRDHARVLPSARLPARARRERPGRGGADPRTAHSRAPPPVSSGSPARPPTCSTSSTRA